MKKISPLSLLFITLAGIVILSAPYFEGTHVLASGISFSGSQLSIPEPLGLVILGIGIVGLARLGRKRLLKQ